MANIANRAYPVFKRQRNLRSAVGQLEHREQADKIEKSLCTYMDRKIRVDRIRKIAQIQCIPLQYAAEPCFSWSVEHVWTWQDRHRIASGAEIEQLKPFGFQKAIGVVECVICFSIRTKEIHFNHES